MILAPPPIHILPLYHILYIVVVLNLSLKIILNLFLLIQKYFNNLVTIIRTL